MPYENGNTVAVGIARRFHEVLHVFTTIEGAALSIEFGDLSVGQVESVTIDFYNREITTDYHLAEDEDRHIQDFFQLDSSEHDDIFDPLTETPDKVADRLIAILTSIYVTGAYGEGDTSNLVKILSQ